jgi:hypothetical protein
MILKDTDAILADIRKSYPSVKKVGQQGYAAPQHPTQELGTCTSPPVNSNTFQQQHPSAALAAPNSSSGGQCWTAGDGCVQATHLHLLPGGI